MDANPDSSIDRPNTPAFNASFTPINSPAKMADIKLDPEETDHPQPEETPIPATPTKPTLRKRGRKNAPANENTPLKTEDPDAEDLNDTPTKKTKLTPGKKVGPIPTSLETAGLSDKLILRMRDEENRNWGDITNAWTAMTGIKVGGSTLRMRYTTMKANFVSIGTEDEARLLKIKKDVEERFEQEKWQKIAEGIQGDGGEKYPATSLQKKFKEMSKKMKAAGISGSTAAGDEDEE